MEKVSPCQNKNSQNFKMLDMMHIRIFLIVIGARAHLSFQKFTLQ